MLPVPFTAKKPASSKLVEEKLDEIVTILDKMNRRDRLRTFGGFIRGMIGIIPVLGFILGMYYFYYHGDELMGRIAEQAAQQAAKVTQQNAGNLMEQLNSQFDQFLVR